MCTLGTEVSEVRLQMLMHHILRRLWTDAEYHTPCYYLVDREGWYVRRSLAI